MEEKPKRAATSTAWGPYLLLAIGVQVAAQVFIVIAPFELKLPSSWGLTLEHALIALAIYFVALAFGVYLSIRHRNRKAFWFQIIVLGMLFIAIAG